MCMDYTLNMPHGLKNNKTSATVVVSCLSPSTNGELREIQDLGSKMTPFDIRGRVKSQSQQLERVSGHDFL